MPSMVLAESYICSQAVVTSDKGMFIDIFIGTKE